MPHQTERPERRASVLNAPRWWLPAVLGLLSAHLAVRAWAAFGAFWYLDDYRLVIEGGDRPLSQRLLEPYDAQFMPVGRALAWLAARSETPDYRVLASISFVLAALAALSCLWMLVTLFGRRWQVLAVWVLYLTSAITVPAYLWWAAGLNQLPLQSVFFVAVGAWVRLQRDGRRRWSVLLVGVLVVGLGSYVKTLLVFPVLAYLSLAYFTSGGPVTRARVLLRRHWAAALVGVLGAGGYLAYYVATAPQIASARRPGVALDLADQMLGQTLSTGLLGGPWRWDDAIAPVAQADPPTWAVALCWAVLATAVVLVARRRRRTLRAWVLLAFYVAADYVLLLTTRAQVVGSVSGTEYRYLTDAACAAVLAVGLAALDLQGATESSETRPSRPNPARWRRYSVRAVAATVYGAVVVGGVASTVGYTASWHSGHPGRAVIGTALEDLEDIRAAEARRADGGPTTVDLDDQILPLSVTGALNVRDASSRRLLGLLSDVARFPSTTESPHLLDADGHVVDAEIDPSATTGPGPQPGCGWPLRAPQAVRLPLDRPLVDRRWWLRIDYLAADDSGLRLDVGTSSHELDLTRGLHRLYVAVERGFDAVTLSGTDPGVTVCVDRVEVGLLVAATGTEQAGSTP